MTRLFILGFLIFFCASMAIEAAFPKGSFRLLRNWDDTIAKYTTGQKKMDAPKDKDSRYLLNPFLIRKREPEQAELSSPNSKQEPFLFAPTTSNQQRPRKLLTKSFTTTSAAGGFFLPSITTVQLYVLSEDDHLADM